MKINSMTQSIAALVLFTFSFSASALPLCKLSTKTEVYSSDGGAPWLSAKKTYNTPKGTCDFVGHNMSVGKCQEYADSHGYSCFQITEGSFKSYNGSLWDKTEYDFTACYACAQ